MVKLVISGYYGFDNLGDEAVLAGSVKSLREVDANIDITVLSNDPATTEHRYNIRAIPRNNIKMVIKSLKESDLFLSGGGSLLQDITGWKSIPYYLGQVLLARLMGSKTAFYAQGIGPVNNQINRKLLKWVGNKADFISLRDNKSRTILIKFGINSQLIKVYADPVFSLQPKIKVNYFKGKKPIIGIVVRPWGNNNYLKPLVEAIEYIACLTKARVVIIPFHYYQDQKISQQLKEQLAINADVLEGLYSPEEMLNIFSSLDFCIGIRLHSLVFAALCKVPFVGISYDPKVTAFLRRMDVPYNFNINNLSAELLIKESNYVWENRKKFILNIDEKVKHYRTLAFDNARDVLELVN